MHHFRGIAAGEGTSGDGTGYQRQLNEQHVEDLKRFLGKGRYRFFPEIVLGLRSAGADDPVVSYAKRRATAADKAYRVTVRLKALRDGGPTRIHRIDGNHRLEAAARLLQEQKRSAAFKDFSKAPFCFVVLDSDRPEDDELAEAMLFNLINSKALPIASEHSLKVLMLDEGPRPRGSWHHGTEKRLPATRSILTLLHIATLFMTRPSSCGIG